MPRECSFSPATSDAVVPVNSRPIFRSPLPPVELLSPILIPPLSKYVPAQWRGARLRTAPLILDPIVWQSVLSQFNYPPENLPMLIKSLHGVGVDPAPHTEQIFAPIQSFFRRNHLLTYSDVERTRAQILEEVRLGRYVKWPPGPLPHIVAPIGVAPKFATLAEKQAFNSWTELHKDELQFLSEFDFRMASLCRPTPLPTTLKASAVTKWRLIHDLTKAGLNDRGKPPSFTMPTVRDICKVIEQGDLIWKQDIISAFRLLPVDPMHRALVGLFFEGAFYVDTRLCFGGNQNPFNYTAVVGRTLQWLRAQLGGRSFGHDFAYIDDHIGVSSPKLADDHMRLFVKAADLLGIPLSEKKAVAPCTRVEILGVWVDTDTMASQGRLRS